MQVSMNGLRRNLSIDVMRLRDIVVHVAANSDDLIEAMNDVIQNINVLNCVYNTNDDSFSDMSNLEIYPIESESV